MVFQERMRTKFLIFVSSDHRTHHTVINAVAAKAMRIANIIHRTFITGAQKLLWPAFQSCVNPLLMYRLPVWTHCAQHHNTVLEPVQRQCTKSIRCMHNLPYTELTLKKS